MLNELFRSHAVNHLKHVHHNNVNALLFSRAAILSSCNSSRVRTEIHTHTSRAHSCRWTCVL